MDKYKKEELFNQIDLYSIPWQKFEDLSLEYIRKIYSEKGTKIEHTQLSKDGGRDIVISHSSKIGTYRAWIECKQHRKKLDLAVISKNVVLVIHDHINKLIFISASEITQKAKQFILEFADNHSFEVQFLDGDNFKEELIYYSGILKKYFGISSDKDIKKRAVYYNYYASEFSDDRNKDLESLEERFVLRRNLDFYLYLYIMNRLEEEIKDVIITPEYNSCDYFPIDNVAISSISPQTDKMVRFFCESKNNKSKKSLPNLHITYTLNDSIHSEIIKTGIVSNPVTVRTPLVGDKVKKFFNNKLDKIIEMAKEHYLHIIFVHGKSGVGKTRYLEEVDRKFEKSNCSTTYINCDFCNSNQVIREILITMLKRLYLFTESQIDDEYIQKVFNISQNNSNEFNALKNFLLTSTIDKDSWVYIKNAIFRLMKSNSEEQAFLFCIDNIQLMDKMIFDFLYETVELFYQHRCNVCFTLSSNDEFSSELSENYKNYIYNLRASTNNLCEIIEVEEFSHEDAEKLVCTAFPNLENNKEILFDILNKSGTKAFDIIMMCEYLKENDIIVPLGENEWYISDSDQYQDFIQSVPENYQYFLKRRINNLKNRSTSEQWSIYNKLFMSLVLFDGALPDGFLNEISITEEMISSLLKMKLLKFDYFSDKITFYHDNLFRYFKDNIHNSSMRTISKSAVKWLFTEENLENSDYDKSRVYALIYSNNERAYEYGEEMLNKFQSNFEMNTALEIIKVLLNVSAIKNNSFLYFKLLVKGAECSWESIDIKQSLSFYEEAEKLIDDIFSRERTSVVCSFYHKYINAMFHLGLHKNAYPLLKKYKSIKGKNDYENFILHNRFSVYYYKTGKFQLAEKQIELSLKYADILDSDFWRSTAYSEYAYNYLRNKNDKRSAQTYFQKAVDLYNENDDETYYRKLEISNQLATVLYFKRNYKDALSNINKSIHDSRAINNSYMEIKALNIKGIILSKIPNQISEAISVWKRALEKSSLIGADNYSCKLCFNVGAAYIASKNFDNAYDYLLQGYRISRNNVFNTLWEQDVISLYLSFVLYLNKDTDTLMKLNDKKLNKHYKTLEKSLNVKEYLKLYSKGIFKYKDVDLSYST